MESDKSKIDNCITLVFLLLITDGLTMGQITDKLSMDRRTIYRYIKLLRGIDIPIVNNRKTRTYYINYLPEVAKKIKEKII